MYYVCYILYLCPCMLRQFNHVQLFVTPWTVAHQGPLSVGLPRQEYWNGLPFPPPGDLPDPGIKPLFPALQAVPLPLAIRHLSSRAGIHVWKRRKNTSASRESIKNVT